MPVRPSEPALSLRMMHLLKLVPCNCRGFALAVPFLAAMAYAYWMQPATSGDPNATNAIIHTCVDAERAAGRSGRACIGRVNGPCKARPENTHRNDKTECDEREFVLWSQLQQKEFSALMAALAPDQQKKLQAVQDFWVRYQSDDCRLPYSLFSKDKADVMGPACTIELKAARALQLRAWRDAVSLKK